MLKPYDYSSSSTSLVAIFFSGGGLVACVFASWLVDKTKKFNLVMQCCAVLSIIMTALMFLSLPTESPWILGANALGIGIGMFPVINISYNYLVELTYPISAAMSNGAMSWFQMVVSTVMSVAVTEFINKWGPDSALWTFLIMESISLVALLFVKQDLRRLEAE